MKKAISYFYKDYNSNPILMNNINNQIENYINGKNQNNNNNNKNINEIKNNNDKVSSNVPQIKSRNPSKGIFDVFKPHRKYKSLGMKFSQGFN